MKRTSERQINKDSPEDDGDDVKSGFGIERADAATLAKRRMVRSPSRPVGAAATSSSEEKKSVFAGVQLEASTKPSFNFGSTTSSTPAFSFGAPAPAASTGSQQPELKGFSFGGSSTAGGFTFGQPAAAPAPSPVASLPGSFTVEAPAPAASAASQQPESKGFSFGGASSAGGFTFGQPAAAPVASPDPEPPAPVSSPVPATSPPTDTKGSADIAKWEEAQGHMLRLVQLQGLALRHMRQYALLELRGQAAQEQAVKVDATPAETTGATTGTTITASTTTAPAFAPPANPDQVLPNQDPDWKDVGTFRVKFFRYEQGWESWLKGDLKLQSHNTQANKHRLLMRDAAGLRVLVNMLLPDKVTMESKKNYFELAFSGVNSAERGNQCFRIWSRTGDQLYEAWQKLIH